MNAPASAIETAIGQAASIEQRGDLVHAASSWNEVRRRFPHDVRPYVHEAMVLNRLGKVDEATSLLRQGRARFPDDETLAIEYAWTLSKQRDLDAAAAQWRGIRIRFPHRIDGYVGGGLVYRQRQEFDEADELYLAALNVHRESSILQVDHAWCAEERGDWPEAIRRWTLVRNRFPDVQEGHVRTGVAMLEEGRIDDAERALEAALARFPDCEEALVQFAWAAHIEERWPLALQRWEQVILKYPQLPKPRRFAAVALKELGRFSEALGVLAPAARMYPDDPDIMILNAWLATALGDFKKAELLWRAVRERLPDEVDGVRGWANVLGDAGRWDDAEAAFAQGFERFPTDVQLAVDWAELPERREQWTVAAQRWRELCERFPDVSATHAGLGRALLRIDDGAGAEVVLRAARERFADDAEIAAAEAEAAQTSGDWPRTIALWGRFRKHFPGQWAEARLGRALRESGQLQPATDHDRIALERYPDDFDLQFELAFALSAQRNWSEALALWASLQLRFPDDEGLRSSVMSILGQALSDQGIGGRGAFEIPRTLLEASHVDGVPARDQAALLRRFESLGDSCEFGMVQRLYHVEQMTLLRWAFTPANHLLTALKTRFDGVGDPDHTEIVAEGDEYLTRDRRYHMQSHTFTSPAAEPLDAFAPEQCRRLQWLKRRLLESLAAATRVFVYTSQDPLGDSGVLALHDAMQVYSTKSKLLVMRVRDAAHPGGSVVRLRAGLWAAYIEKLSTVDISVATWLKVCQSVVEQVDA